MFKFSVFFTGEAKVFDRPVKGREAVNQLLSLRQGNRSVSEYSDSFRILAAETGWDHAALQGVFFKGFSEEIKRELAIRVDTKSRDALIDHSSK